MANKSLFKSTAGKLLPKADILNEAGGNAYAFGPQHALAQLAATGCLNATFYASAETQLANVIELASKVDPLFLAKTAVYAREVGLMKDMPALLVAMLSVRSPALFAQVFDRVIDDPKMLRTFVQIMRSGQVGRKSLGTRPKKKIVSWLESRTDDQLFRASVGDAPSIADVLKMVHPKPATDSRRALYGYLVGKEHAADQLPQLVKRFEQYKADKTGEVPDVPFQLLTSLSLGPAEWTAIARNASWQTTRMNLNTFARHGVFEVPGLTELVAARLRDPKAIERARVLPYQLLMAYLATRGTGVPAAIAEALQDAMEHATRNVPPFFAGNADAKVWVLPDVSSSMQSPVTGFKKGATSAARCVDVAALVAATILRQNRSAEVLCFDDGPKPVQLNPRDSIITNAQRLAAVGGGGTNTSAPLALMNAQRARADLVIYVSDNQSWVDGRAVGAPTQTMVEWNTLVARNPGAKLVCIDLQPYAHSQTKESANILNVGGFSDRVFEVILAFAKGGLDQGHWVSVIDATNV
jgi:60 kDa SS-A/Ro ribonucleoprotein